MIGTMHRDMTTRVAASVLGDTDLAKRIGSWASFPDEVDDICVYGVGAEIFHAKFCSVTHFTVPQWVNGDPKAYKYDDWRTMSFRGWGWNLDRSVPRIDLPDRELHINQKAWHRVVGKNYQEHPLLALVRDLKRQGCSTAADEITFPSGLTMVHWLTPCAMSKWGVAALGCILHIIQDGIYHHAQGWMLRGHATHEGDMAERWFGVPWMAGRDRLIAGQRRLTRKMWPGEAMAKSALFSYFNPSADNEIRCAVSHTAAVLRWWKENAK